MEGRTGEAGERHRESAVILRGIVARDPVAAEAAKRAIS
jgi:hypothetical protein